MAIEKQFCYRLIILSFNCRVGSQSQNPGAELVLRTNTTVAKDIKQAKVDASPAKREGAYKRKTMIKRIIFISSLTLIAKAGIKDDRIEQVSEMSGLVAFWTFGNPQAGIWQSVCDSSTSAVSYPLYLRQIGDDTRYTTETWPYTDSNSQIRTDSSGPLRTCILLQPGIYIRRITAF